jgi:hypothetical protein
MVHSKVFTSSFKREKQKQKQKEYNLRYLFFSFKTVG